MPNFNHNLKYITLSDTSKIPNGVDAILSLYGLMYNNIEKPQSKKDLSIPPKPISDIGSYIESGLLDSANPTKKILGIPPKPISDISSYIGSGLLDSANASKKIPSKDTPKDIASVALTYETSIIINPADSAADLTPSETSKRLELDHTVKRPPRLSAQLKDPRRNNMLVYINGQVGGLNTNTSDPSYIHERGRITEQVALRQLYDFLNTVASSRSRYASVAAAMREELTFIGEIEYHEAVAGIASYWKYELDKNRALKIIPITGAFLDADNDDTVHNKRMIKSDEFFLENILSHFSDEEMSRYGSRINIDYHGLEDKTDARNLKVVLLDDWTISGSQLFSLKDRILGKYPHLARSIEIQLIVANDKRIRQGMETYYHDGTSYSIPVRSYYIAHDSTFADTNAHITGFHSSVDFDFEDTIWNMVLDLRQLGNDTATMVAPTNIVRPYRYEGFTRENLIHTERLRALKLRAMITV